MKKNIGLIDKVARIIVALVLAVLYFTHVVTGVAGIILLVLAAVFVITSLVSFCPLYNPLGINTDKRKE